MDTHVYTLSTLVLWGLSGFGICFLIMLWYCQYSRAVAERRLSAPSDALQRLCGLLLVEAMKTGSSYVVFGVPPKKCKIEKGDFESELSEEDSDAIGVTINDREISYMPNSGVRKLPVWFCSQDRCLQSRGIPISLLFPVVECYLYYESSGMDTSCWQEVESVISYTVEMNEDYCFAVKIREVLNDKTP